MSTAAHGSEHVVSYLVVAWGFMAASVAFAAGLVTISAYFGIYLRRLIIYRLSFCSSLVTSRVPGLRMSYEGEDLADPHVLGIELEYRGRADITGDSFTDGHPFSVDVGVPLVGLIEAEFRPEQRPLPKVEVSGNEVRVGPGLLRRGQVMRLTVLADGAAGRLSTVNPLAGVQDQQRAAEPMKKAPLASRVLWIAVTVLIVIWIVANPTSAGNSIHSWVNGIISFFGHIA